MAWIESHQSLGTHIKLRRLARSLDISRAQAVGHLHYFWWWALDNAPSGDVSKLAPHEIAEAAEWTGDSALFDSALRQCGWLDADGAIHDWGDYVGRIVALREGNRTRQRRHRKVGRNADVTRDITRDITRDGPVTSRTRHAAESRNGNGTESRDVTGLPNPTQPNPTVPNPTEPVCVSQSVRVRQTSASPPEGTHDKDAHADSSWPSLGEVLTRAELRGMPKECAEKWWLEHDARGGCDRHGQPLKRWESALLAFATSWRSVEAQQAARSQSPQRSELIDHSKGFFG